VGIALALGPNINLGRRSERERAASAAVERAQSLGAARAADRGTTSRLYPTVLATSDRI